jgi:pimeloyl-ACP methyl ester carboxylesterase
MNAAPRWAPLEPVATAVALVTLHCSRWSLLPFLERQRDRQLEAWGLKRFQARAQDGAKLDTAFLPAPPLENPPASPRLPVLIAHGWWQVKASMFAYAQLLRAQGHNCILPDLRAHGRSGGRYTTFGCREREDLSTILDQAQAQGFLAPNTKVITLGLSLGAATVLQHAAMDNRVAAVVALAPYADMTSAVTAYTRLYGRGLNPAWVLRGFARAAQRIGFTMEAASTLQAMPHITVPVLIAVGAQDRNLTKQDHAQKLQAAKTRGPCRLLEVPGATHFNIHHRTWPELTAAVQAFCAAAGEAQAP